MVRTGTSEIAAYYDSDVVRARLAEYCGGTLPSNAFSAKGLAGFGGARFLSEPDGAPVAQPGVPLGQLLDEGADVCRSLADDGGTLLHLDLDYVNPEEPGIAWRRPGEVFPLLEPLYDAVRGTLDELGAHALALMTPRGYHFVARAPLGGSLQQALVELGGPSAGLKESSAVRCGGKERESLFGRAHEGAGRLLELLAHRVQGRARGLLPFPVTLSDVPSKEGGPVACLDLSAYGDPLFCRYVRCAFSSNQKSGMWGLAPERPFVIVLPRRSRPLAELLAVREDPARAERMAAESSARVPDLGDGAMRWVEEYRASRLAAFHAAFDRGPHVDPALWPFTWDRLELDELPDCVRLPIASPNPLLLDPRWLRTVALVLWSRGWHPRSIAGLVRSRYEKDFGWGAYWSRYHAATRAEFYVRLFCGALAVAGDELELDCAVQQQRRACSRASCGHDLRGYAEGLTRVLGELRT